MFLSQSPCQYCASPLHVSHVNIFLSILLFFDNVFFRSSLRNNWTCNFSHRNFWVRSGYIEMDWYWNVWNWRFRIFSWIFSKCIDKLSPLSPDFKTIILSKWDELCQRLCYVRNNALKGKWHGLRVKYVAQLPWELQMNSNLDKK